MKFSKVLLAFWVFCMVLAVTSICLGAWLFTSIYFLELSTVQTELHDFHVNLFWWVLGEIVMSVLAIAFWLHLHCRLAQKKIEQKIPVWIALNILHLYVTFGCFLFPAVSEYRLYHRKSGHNISSSAVAVGGVKNEQKALVTAVAHFYFGLLLMKALTLGGLILSLFEHLQRLKQIDVFLNDLNLGGKRGKVKRDSFIL